MRLPFAHQAVIAPEKIRNYLLSSAHPIGATKARVFASVGYGPDTWKHLQMDLLELARSNEAVDLGYGSYGQKFAIRGILKGPSGKSLAILTIWIVRKGEGFPRLVTGYPEEIP